MEPVRSGRARWAVAASSWSAVLRLVLLAVSAAVLGWWAVVHGGQTLDEVNAGTAALGFWAPLVYAGFFALAQGAFVPGSVLTASAGVLFGVGTGIATALVGGIAGAVLSFAVARRLGRPAVAALAGSGRLAQLDARLSRRGFAAVLVLRLVPVFPFAVVNYGAGVTAVRFGPYLAATALGIVPATVVYATLGGSLREPGAPGLSPALGGLLLLAVVGGLLARRAGAGPDPG